MFRLLCPFLLAAFAFSGLALAADYRLGDLAILDPYCRPSLAGAVNSAAYFRLQNSGTGVDRLLRAESPRAKAVELHTHIQDGAVMRMRPVEGIDIGAGGQVALMPGGLHIMLLGLERPLKLGENLPITLYFERAGAITLEIPVEMAPPAGAKAPVPAH